MLQVNLKTRIVAILLFTSLVPFLFAVLASFSAITELQEDKLRAGVAANLHQKVLAQDNAMESLNRVAQQLSDPTVSVNLLDAYLQATTPSEKALSRVNLKNQVDLVAFTNPSISLVMFWFANEELYDFETGHVNVNFTPQALVPLKKSALMTYHVPHPTAGQYKDHLVLSAFRRVGANDRDSIYLYIETAFKLSKAPSDFSDFGGNSQYLMLNGDGLVVFSELQDSFPIGMDFGRLAKAANFGLVQDQYWTLEASTAGWGVVNLIPRAAYDSVKDSWLITIGVLGLAFVICALAASLVLWRWVYRPFNRFNKELDWLEYGAKDLRATPVHMEEFDGLLVKFHGMKHQIIALLDEVGRKERLRADLEIEKLRYQINPHFLLNSLNTIHWHATLKGQTEIDSITLALIRLLQYNLGKQGPNTTLAEEIAAVSDYVALQKTRYDFLYHTRILVEPESLNHQIPRFILQPLVENAIAHGIKENGRITVTVEQLASCLRISVRDDGIGFPEGTTPTGIGLDYVQRMLENTFGGQAKVEIRSVPGEGTTVVLDLPFPKENQ